MTQDVTRRTIVRGAAWTVPAIAVAAAVPAVAASTPDPCASLYFDMFTTACHVTSDDPFSQQTYGWFVRANNTGATASTFELRTVLLNGQGSVGARLFTGNSVGLFLDEVSTSAVTVPAHTSMWFRFQVLSYVSNPTSVSWQQVSFNPNVVCATSFPNVSFTDFAGSCPVLKLN
ncbi:hypothetical protein [Agromyces mangrovi Wang et al. 2018]|uniref:hypothetical protein n=1 Tax=Agromyces mangrovi TaxID=1858653 RepID=UPI00257296E0|nr:hypothetical protein [Agromyces mangrovi]BDZ63654.1 hypothetical protein GCM10025877_05920 [Agromyces mangrovi]